MIHFVGHKKSQYAKKLFYDFSMTQHSCHAYQVSSFLPTHNVVLSFDIKDASLKNQYVFNLYVKALVCPLVMTWDCSFCFLPISASCAQT